MPYYHSSELYHHGILGMKWGVRRYQNKDGSLTAAGRKRYSTEERIENAKAKYTGRRKIADANYRKASSEYKDRLSGRSTDSILNDYTNDDKKLDRAADKWGADRKSAKEKYKKEISSIRKGAVRKYSEAYDKMTNAQDENDAAWREVKSLYAKLGKNKIERIINAAKGESAEAKAYSKAYDRWSNRQDVLDKKWHELDQLYADTGSNYVDRVLNNIKYRS